MEVSEDGVNIICNNLECKDISHLVRSNKRFQFLTEHDKYLFVPITKFEIDNFSEYIIFVGLCDSILVSENEQILRNRCTVSFSIKLESFEKKKINRDYRDFDIDLDTVYKIYSNRNKNRARDMLLKYYHTVLQRQFPQRTWKRERFRVNPYFEKYLLKLKYEIRRYQYLQGSYVKRLGLPLFPIKYSNVTPEEDITGFPLVNKRYFDIEYGVTIHAAHIIFHKLEISPEEFIRQIVTFVDNFEKKIFLLF